MTERLDYNSAFALVAIQTTVVTLRTLRLRGLLPAVLAAIAAGGSILGMTIYMNFVHFDYGFNVKVSIAVGVLGIAMQTVQTGGLLLAAWKGQVPLGAVAYCWKGVASMVLVAVLTAVFEVNDFPPVLWGLWDAHAFWHLTTAPVGLLWYSYMCDDLDFMKGHHGAAVGDLGQATGWTYRFWMWLHDPEMLEVLDQAVRMRVERKERERGERKGKVEGDEKWETEGVEPLDPQVRRAGKGAAGMRRRNAGGSGGRRGHDGSRTHAHEATEDNEEDEDGRRDGWEAPEDGEQTQMGLGLDNSSESESE